MTIDADRSKGIADFCKAADKLARRVPHCWEVGPETDDGCSTTCMLLDGHDGPHEWTRDDNITVSFAPMPEATADN